MKIVSLLPSTTEICFALGLGGSVFGVTHECDYPAAARSLPQLTRNVLPAGEYSSAEIDRMVAERVLNGCAIYDLDVALLAALEPDLILTQALCPVCAVSYDDVVGAAAALPRMPRVAAFEPHTVADIIASIAEVARLAGVPEQGDRLCTQLTDRIAAVQRRVVALPAVRVLCLEWLDPPMVGGHWVPEMVRLAGGIDVLGVAGQPSVPVSWPEVEASDPDMIVLMPCGFDLPATVEVAAEL
ncbi:MAG: cobalamin-binding protein, partial [Chloroflexi bacterium]